MTPEKLYAILIAGMLSFVGIVALVAFVILDGCLK